MYHFISEKSDRTVLEGLSLTPHLCFRETPMLGTLPVLKLVSKHIGTTSIERKFFHKSTTQQNPLPPF